MLERPIDDDFPRSRHAIEDEIAGHCGHVVDLADDRLVRALLFDELGLPATAAFAIDDETLSEHARDHLSPLTELVLEWRNATRLGR